MLEVNRNRIGMPLRTLFITETNLSELRLQDRRATIEFQSSFSRVMRLSVPVLVTFIAFFRGFNLVAPAIGTKN